MIYVAFGVRYCVPLFCLSSWLQLKAKDGMGILNKVEGFLIDYRDRPTVSKNNSPKRF
jgi:hypothetical protein